MKPIEWENCEFGQTWMWLEERAKYEKHQREQHEEAYYINRLNTFYQLSAWTNSIKRPTDLYELPSDKGVKVKAIPDNLNPFSPENDAIFEKMDKMKFDKGGGDFINEVIKKHGKPNR